MQFNNAVRSLQLDKSTDVRTGEGKRDAGNNYCTHICPATRAGRVAAISPQIAKWERKAGHSLMIRTASAAAFAVKKPITENRYLFIQIKAMHTPPSEGIQNGKRHYVRCSAPMCPSATLVTFTLDTFQVQ